jgi:hypothetical protein
MQTMKTKLIAVALAAASTITSAHAQTTTPDSVKPRIGTLKFEKGYLSGTTRPQLGLSERGKYPNKSLFAGET